MVIVNSDTGCEYGIEISNVSENTMNTLFSDSGNCLAHKICHFYLLYVLLKILAKMCLFQSFKFKCIFSFPLHILSVQELLFLKL